MILVTGATGTVGKAVLDALAGRDDVIATTRDRAKEDARTRWFDFEKPLSYSPALEGVSRLFLLLPPGMRSAPERFRSVLFAAKRAGATHAIFLSVRNADRIPILPHRGLERELERSGLGWTHLRPNDFMQNFATVPVLRDGIRGGELWAAGGDARTSYVDVRDVGEAAARVLTEDGHEGRAYPLTGPAPLSLHDVARELTDELARPVRFMRPSLPAFFRHARAAGAPAPLAAVMTGIGVVSRLGLADGVDPELPGLLGRAPRPFSAFARDYRDAWA